MRTKTAAVFTALTCVIALIGSACGGGHHGRDTQAAKDAAADPTNSTTTTALPTSTTRPSAGSAKPAAKKPAGASGSTTTTAPGAKPGIAMPPWFTVTVDKKCLHAQNTQGFTVRGGDPGQLLIYDTAYANGTDDFTDHYGTGSGKAKFDSKGTYRTTFVLAGKVPPGTAYLSVASSHQGQLMQTRTTFVIKPLNQSCP